MAKDNPGPFRSGDQVAEETPEHLFSEWQDKPAWPDPQTNQRAAPPPSSGGKQKRPIVGLGFGGAVGLVLALSLVVGLVFFRSAMWDFLTGWFPEKTEEVTNDSGPVEFERSTLFSSETTSLIDTAQEVEATYKAEWLVIFSNQDAYPRNNLRGLLVTGFEGEIDIESVSADAEITIPADGFYMLPTLYTSTGTVQPTTGTWKNLFNSIPGLSAESSIPEGVVYTWAMKNMVSRACVYLALEDAKNHMPNIIADEVVRIAAEEGVTIDPASITSDSIRWTGEPNYAAIAESFHPDTSLMDADELEAHVWMMDQIEKIDWTASGDVACTVSDSFFVGG